MFCLQFYEKEVDFTSNNSLWQVHESLLLVSLSFKMEQCPVRPLNIQAHQLWAFVYQICKESEGPWVNLQGNWQGLLWYIHKEPNQPMIFMFTKHLCLWEWRFLHTAECVLCPTMSSWHQFQSLLTVQPDVSLENQMTS